MNDQNVVEGFYRTVAEMLECDAHQYTPFPFGRRTRWNNRKAGNGRYLGFGLVRYFGPNHIHVSLTKPMVNGVFGSVEAALTAISRGIHE